MQVGKVLMNFYLVNLGGGRTYLVRGRETELNSLTVPPDIKSDGIKEVVIEVSLLASHRDQLAAREMPEGTAIIGNDSTGWWLQVTAISLEAIKDVVYNKIPDKVVTGGLGIAAATNNCGVVIPQGPYLG